MQGYNKCKENVRHLEELANGAGGFAKEGVFMELDKSKSNLGQYHLEINSRQLDVSQFD